jgi:hypothetical protein
MAGRRVLVLGVDPTKLTEWDPAPVLSEIERGRRRFGELGIEADWCLADLHGDPQSEFAAALAGNDYACVVIGGGLRSREPDLELLFETVVNLVRTRQPDAAIAFNHRPDDCADAALRWL